MSGIPSDGWLARLHRFWFSPTDPTTLGFIRVVTGIMILYIHAVYFLDLQAYFGKTGFYSLAEVELERKESPSMLSDWSGPNAWVNFKPNSHVPVYPHRQDAVMLFLRTLSSDPAAVRDRLAFLIRIQNEVLRTATPKPQPNPKTGLSILDLAAKNNWAERKKVGSDSLDYLSSLYTAEKARAPQMDAFVNPTLRTPKERMPPNFLLDLPQDGPNSRSAVRQEIEQLLAVMPADSTQRKYVVDHLIETGFENRQSLVEFLLQLPSDAGERKKQLDYLERWNSEAGKAYRIGNSTFSLWFHITDPTEMLIAHSAILFIMFLFTIGLFTRVTAVLTWLAAVSYIHRTQQVLFGMDTMMNILLIYLMIGNCGAALSVDRLIARYRAARGSIRRSGSIDATAQRFLAAPPKSVSAGFALRLLQIHFCIIYLAAGMSKLKGQSWWNTMAAWDTMANPEFTLIHFEWFENFLRSVVQHRFLFAIGSGIVVVFTFVIELGFPFLVWTRLRPYIIVLACLFHMGIGCMMGLNLFGMLMMTMILGYIPGSAIRQSLTGGKNLERFSLHFDPKNETHAKAAATVAMADVEGQIAFVPEEKSSYRLKANGNTKTGAEIATHLFSSLALLKLGKLLGLIPWVRRRIAV